MPILGILSLVLPPDYESGGVAFTGDVSGEVGGFEPEVMRASCRNVCGLFRSRLRDLFLGSDL